MWNGVAWIGTLAWIGFDEPDAVWYPTRNFKTAPYKLKDFHDANPEAPGPPARLREWLRADDDDADPEDVPDDDKPETRARVAAGLHRYDLRRRTGLSAVEGDTGDD